MEWLLLAVWAAGMAAPVVVFLAGLAWLAVRVLARFGITW